MLEEMIAYMELHLISLYQDAEKLQTQMDEFEGDYDSDEYEELEITDMNNTGEIYATSHLLSVARDILQKTNERAYDVVR
jgi:hypothetical protein